MKNLISSALLLLALLLPATAAAYDFEVDGIFYNFCNEEGAVQVTTPPYSESYSGTVNIPAAVTYNDSTYTVTAIGELAFSYRYTMSTRSSPSGSLRFGFAKT